MTEEKLTPSNAEIPPKGKAMMSRGLRKDAFGFDMLLAVRSLDKGWVIAPEFTMLMLGEQFVIQCLHDEHDPIEVIKYLTDKKKEELETEGWESLDNHYMDVNRIKDGEEWMR